jgi:hypothetical protein
MRHHFRHPQAMLNKGSLFYSHCGSRLIVATALGLLCYALIFVVQFPPFVQNRQLDE